MKAPVNYAFWFSGHVTPPNARPCPVCVGPDLICQPRFCARYKRRTRPPPLFQQLSPSLLFPSPLSPSCTSSSCLRPRRTPTYSPASPLVPTEWIRRGQWEKCRSATADSYSLDASAASSRHDADEAPGVPAGRRRRGHATALDASLLPFKLRPSIHHTSYLHRGRPRPRQHADWLRYHHVITTSPCC